MQSFMPFHWLLLAWGLSFSAASLFDHHEALGMACALSAQQLFTNCEEQDYNCYCDSTLYVFAVENCIGKQSHYNSTLMGLAFDKFDFKFCEVHNAQANTTDVWNAENRRINPTVTQKAYDLAYEGEKSNMEEKTVSVWLGLGLILYWVAIVTFVTAKRVLHVLTIRLLTARIAMHQASWPVRTMERYVLWPALLNSKHMQKIEFFRGWLSFSLPSRLESIIVCVYVILCIVFMLTPYTFMNNDPLFNSRWKEMMRYASDRAGIIATIQMPMLFLFAARNNILIWVTGWSYSTFNTYHRAVARITYLLLIVHAVMKHIFSLSYGGSLTKYYYPVPYFRYGCAAMGLFSLMVATAMLRARSYEWFYRLHQAFAISGLVCSIYHLNGIGFKPPLWIAIALGATDWIIRCVRIVLFNINFIAQPLPGSRRSSFATARLYEGELIKLSITTPVRWVCKPGQYVFLHTRRWNFIGGHPFSVAGVPKRSRNKLELVIKAHKGFTRTLCNMLDAKSCSPSYPYTIPVYVEGPYGITAPVCNSEEILLFAGGIGITGVLAYVHQVATTSFEGDTARTVHLFWAVRSKLDIAPFIEQLSELIRYPNVHARIFLRSAATVRDPMSGAGDAGGIGVDIDLDAAEKVDVNTAQYSVSTGLVSVGLSGNESEKMLVTDDPDVFKHRRKSSAAAAFFHKMSRRRSSARTSGSGSDVSRKHKSRLSDLRHSFVDFMMASDPEFEDKDDYDKERFLENPNDSSTSLEEAPRSPRDYSQRNSSNQHYSTSPQYSANQGNASFYDSRLYSPAFVDAGFADQIEYRRLSELNPFDENVSPYTDTLYSSTASTPIDSNGKQTGEVEALIEPSGMDITQIIRRHFKQSDSSICVLGCGPDRMMDTLRWTCCECLDLAKNGRVDYYEEAFRW